MLIIISHRKLPRLPAIAPKAAAIEAGVATADVAIMATPSLSMLFLGLDIMAKVPMHPEPKVTALLCDKVVMVASLHLLSEDVAAMAPTTSIACLRPTVATACPSPSLNTLPTIMLWRHLWK